MELHEPRMKRNYKFKKYAPLKELQNKINSFFDGFSVTIENSNDVKSIYEGGFFGKGNLSRSYPISQKTEIIRKRQYLKRLKWEKKDYDRSKIKKVIVIPDSDTDDESYFTNLKPEYKIDRCDMKEKLCLSLTEAYYLVHNIACLSVYEEGILLDKRSMWNKFSSHDPYFIPNYITYCHFRKKGWIVKSAVKFGGDYLLYKGGPPYYHASYVVIIDVVNENLSRIKNQQRRSMEIVNIIGLNRLCENVGKELLLCQLIWPEDLKLVTQENLSQILINEILVRRWTETQES